MKSLLGVEMLTPAAESASFSLDHGHSFLSSYSSSPPRMRAHSSKGSNRFLKSLVKFREFELHNAFGIQIDPHSTDGLTPESLRAISRAGYADQLKKVLEARKCISDRSFSPTAADIPSLPSSYESPSTGFSMSRVSVDDYSFSNLDEGFPVSSPQKGKALFHSSSPTRPRNIERSISPAIQHSRKMHPTDGYEKNSRIISSDRFSRSPRPQSAPSAFGRKTYRIFFFLSPCPSFILLSIYALVFPFPIFALMTMVEDTILCFGYFAEQMIFSRTV